MTGRRNRASLAALTSLANNASTRFTQEQPDCHGSGGLAWARIELVDILDPAGPRRLVAHWRASDSTVSLHSRLGTGIRIAFRFKPFGLEVRGDNFVGHVGP
jgi:hypothetical protein